MPLIGAFWYNEETFMGKYLIIVPLLVGFWKPIAITERTYRPQVLGDIIYANFGEHSKAMTAIFKAESGLNPKAMNWNCKYPDPKDPKRLVGKSCDAKDRAKAFSVDCGIGQINYPGRQCPKESFDMETNVSLA